jgi:alpha-beta hydrolase superfamily lysophospholipase
MLDRSHTDYSHLDTPDVLMRLFHPRAEYGSSEKRKSALDALIPVEKDVVVGGRFHMAAKSAPNVLFFHGNGEIVADYDELGPVYNRMGMNFLPVDYRGYGRSTGAFVVMGRSLGSASALELADQCKTQIDGLVVESGFAYTGPLLALLGVNTAGFVEGKGMSNLERIKTWDKPALIIHAEFDHIIPFSDGQALYDACPSSDKTLLKVPGANHNDIFMRGLEEYMKGVKNLCERSSAAA